MCIFTYYISNFLWFPLISGSLLQFYSLLSPFRTKCYNKSGCSPPKFLIMSCTENTVEIGRTNSFHISPYSIYFEWYTMNPTSFFFIAQIIFFCFVFVFVFTIYSISFFYLFTDLLTFSKNFMIILITHLSISVYVYLW